MVNDAAELPSVVGAWVGGQRVFEKHDSTLNALGDRWAREVSSFPREAAHVS